LQGILSIKINPSQLQLSLWPKSLKVAWVARTFLGSLDSSLGRRLERLCEHPEQRPPELGVRQRLVQPIGVGDFVLLGPGATRGDQRTQQYLQTYTTSCH
jgi:hypothetical protein